jgi:hypothetical protein
MEINGEDDTNEEIINMPSHRDALAASLVLQQYVADLNDPCTRKLEAILAGFGRQVHLQELRDMKLHLFHLKLFIIILFSQYIVI